MRMKKIKNYYLKLRLREKILIHLKRRILEKDIVNQEENILKRII